MMKRALWLLVALSLPFVFGGLHPASGAGEAFLTPTEPEFNGLPDLEADSGRFLGVSGVANQGIPESQTTGEEGDPGQLILVLVYDFDEIAGTDVKIAIFDGDTKGLWDQRDDLPPVAPEPGILKPYDTAYRVYPDPTAGVARALAIGGSETPGNVIPIGGDGDPEGSAVVPLFDRKASESPFAGTNATWVDLLDDPRDPSARVGTSNVYVYTLRVTLTAGRSGKLSGFELNGFKVATNGLMRLPRGTLLGFVGGAVDIRTVAGLAQTEDPLPGTSYFVPGTSERLTNQYQGDFTFRFRLNREVCDDLTFFEADGDWNKPIASDGLDLAPTGIPPDDGGMYQWKKQLIDNSAFAIPLGPVDQEKGLHGLLWEFRDPDGVVRKSSSDAGFGHPSFDALYQLDNFGTVFQGTTISKDVLNANLGTWALVWRGVDSRNAIWMKASGALGPSFEGPTTTGRVWCDTNRNGAFDPGEDPLVGATVLVRPVPPDGTVFPFKTDVDGIWTTTSLAAGSYEVTGVEPDPTSGVTFVPSTPLPKQFTVDACDGGRVDIPGSCLQMGKIAGRVWCDNNENARYDVPPDKPLAGVKVIIRHEGALDPVETVFTDADGKYESGELPAGKYSVSVDPDNDPKLDGVTALTPTAVLTTVIAGQTSIVDFRFRCPASVSGYVIRETRPCDGAWQKDTEVGIADVEVELTLLDEDGIPTSDVRKTTTSALGFYEFLNVTPGTYRISVDESQVNVVRLEPSSPVAIAPLVVEPLTRYDDNNFFFCPGEIQVRVFRKARGDACENVVETGDTPLAGVKVLLAGTSDTTTKGPFFATTNASGVAVFTNLDADTYTVSIDGSQPSLVALKPSAPEAASTSVALPAGELKVVDSVWCEDLFSITGFVRREPECIPWWNSRGDGLGGVKVELRLATDLPTAPPRFTETTTANGFYAFLDIPQGSYVVSVPPGQVPLKDMTATSPTKVRVKEAPAEVNFYFGSAGVLVEVLVDIDAGGTPDGGLRTTVTLEKLDPPGQGTTFRARTDANGRIRFPLPSQNALLPGSWRVSIPRQPNLIPKGPLSVIVDLAVCAPETVRFEFYGTCSIVGTVIKETVDCDGVRQRDEPGIARVEVVLLQVSPAAPARKATTDALGNYRFTRLPRGSYIVVVDGGQPMLVDLKPNSPTSVRVICVPPDEARVDFYFCAPGRICGTVFREPLQDCDGEYDRGDTGLGGVVVTLTPIDPAGRPISKGTQKDGSYCFPTLDPGRYSVSVDPSQPLLIDLGSTTATVVAVNLDPAEVETVDFGFAEQAIEGIVFREPVNASDGIYDPGVDTGIPGVTVRAVKLTQPDKGMVRMAVTGVGGSYFLNDLPPGGWEVTVESGVPAGLVPTTPEIVRLRLPVCQVGEANFGFSPEPLSSICGTVFLEKWDECNGVFDGNDVGIPGVTVQLVKKDEPGKGRRKNTVTDAKGDYCFDDLPAGRYLVKVPGRQPQLVDLSPSTPEKQRVVTQPGDKIEDVDFGYCPPCPREPCCEGDLHEVVIETRFWVDEWTEWYDIYAFFREECAPGAAEIDYAGVFYRGDFPGAVTGYNDVLSLESATREGNWLYVRLRLTAQGCAFPRGFFGNKDRCVVVTFNGKRKVGHTIFRCEYVRPGSWFTSGEDCKLPECPPDGETKVLTTEAWNDRPDGCRADYRVLDTYGWNNWLTCEGKPECKEQSETSKCGYNLVELELDYWVKKGEREHEYGVRLRKWGQVDMDGVDLMFSGTEWHGAKKGWGGMLTLTDLKRVKKGQYADLWRARMLIQACDRCDGNPSPLPEQLAVDSTLDEWTHDYWLDLNYSSNPPMEVGPVLWRGEFTGVSILRWLSVEDAAWCPPNVCRDCPDDQPCTDCGDRPGGGDDPNGEPRGG